MIKSCITDTLPGPGRVLAGPVGCPAGYQRRLSENVIGAWPVSVGIPNGTRPGAVKSKVYRAGTARASAGFLQGLSGVPTMIYIYAGIAHW